MTHLNEFSGAAGQMKPWGRKLRGHARIAAAVFVLALWPLAQAAAHALVVASTPAADATIEGPDFDLHLQFSDRIDKKRSKLSVVSPSGQSYPVAPLDVERADTLAGHVVGLPPGPYRLLWQVLAVDGHITRGEIPFTAAAP
jgi:methionine-rich copper-binding protein CopC